MKAKLFLGPVPADESCTQTVDPNYGVLAVNECEAFIELIQRVMADEGIALAHGVKLAVEACPHDFGTYYEVAVRYDDDNEDAVNLAVQIENLAPSEWDDVARTVLGLV